MMSEACCPKGLADTAEEQPAGDGRDVAKSLRLFAPTKDLRGRLPVRRIERRLVEMHDEQRDV
jgi:hypothetical protein